MKILRFDAPSFPRDFARLNRRSAPSPAIQSAVQDILQAVRRGGDAALLRLAKKFGGPALRPDQMRVTEPEIEKAMRSLASDVHEAIDTARRNVAAFASRSLRKDWTMRNAQGVRVGERFDPFDRVGIYVPGGTAPLVSTAVMTCTLAATAGVPSIVAVSPAGPDGTLLPELLAALHLSGATEIYRVGGAQAIAALAFGTPTIAPVRKVFGPGNAYVVEAKRQVFGTVAVDLLPGPSEVFVIADDTAPPEWIAADLLAQAEHGVGSVAILATPSESLLSAVQAAMRAQLKGLSRAESLRTALKNAVLVLTRDLDQAIALANDFASEHLTLAIADPASRAGEITSAGAIFLGAISPVVGGDFVAGPSHELPTGGAGKSFAGLTVDQFQRRVSVVEFDKRSLAKSLPTIETFSRVEGLDAHGRSAAIRFET